MGEFIKQGFRLLMVDDSPDDVFFVHKALQKSGTGHFFHSVSRVQEAIDYLRGEGTYADRHQFPFPNALLVDLKMPGLNGFDLLEWLLKHPECKIIPTIGFSSSAMDSDVHRFYVLGGNAFLTKPNDFQNLTQLIQATYDFWSHCQTPPPPRGEKCD